MAKTIAPLLSFDAAGQVASSIVYSQWRGVKYARRYVVPSNPRTTSQVRNRTVFSLLREMYKLLPAEGRAPWTAYATGRKFTDMNAFVGENRRALGEDVDMQEFIGSPGARGGLPADGLAAVAGASSGEVDATFEAPTIPTDWSLDSVVALAFPDQDPDGRFDGPFAVGEVDLPTLEVTLSGLPADTLCVVTGWTVWTKPDGNTAYGPSLVTTATSAA